MSFPPSDNVYMTDLPVGIDEDGVRNLFTNYGEIVSVKVLPTKIEGSKGAALVRFSNVQSAKWVVENLNGNMPEGLTEPIVARFAANNSEKGKGKDKGGYDKGGKGGFAPMAAQGGGDNVFVGDLPEAITEDWMRQLFGAYGSITQVKILPPKQPGQKGAGLMRLSSPAEAQWLVDNLNGNMPEGLTEPIVVKFAQSGKGKDYGKADAGKGGGWAGPYDGGKGGWDGWDGKGKGWEGGGKSVGKGGSIKGLLDSAIKGGTVPGGDGGGRRPAEQCVYIRGLPTDTTDLALYQLFGSFGAIAPRGVKAMLHPDGSCTSVGFVDYMSADTAHMAVEAMNGFVLSDGNTLFLKIKDGKGKGKGDEGFF